GGAQHAETYRLCRHGLCDAQQRLRDASQEIAANHQTGERELIHRVAVGGESMPHDVAANEIAERAEHFVIAGAALACAPPARLSIPVEEFFPAHIRLEIHAAVLEIF